MTELKLEHVKIASNTKIKTTLLNDAYSQTQSCSGAKGGLASGANSQSSEKILWAGNY